MSPPRFGRFRIASILLLLATLCCCIPGLNAAELTERAPIADGLKLRVLAIGDSITWGAQSSDSAGYRKSLRAKLVARGNDVDFVGSLTSGSFVDNQHEGHRGRVIDEIRQRSGLGISLGPNIVLLHAGTNDMNRNIDISDAPQRLKSLINVILKATPTTVVLVAQIVPAKPAEIQTRVDNYNAAIPNIVNAFVANGHKVAAVSMATALNHNDLDDNLHPNDGGYEKMAAAWYDWIVSADARGWIEAPQGNATEHCDPTPRWENKGIIASGARGAYGDGDFEQSWSKIGVIAKGACSRSRLHFMDLDGDGYKDYACVDDDIASVKVYRMVPDSNGKPQNKWDDLGMIAKGQSGRKGSGVLFADLNGDGKDDYIYVDPSNGDVSAYINGGKNSDGVWQWKSLGTIANGVGAKKENLQLVDISGDGRADFCLVDQSSGRVEAWLNMGDGDAPDFHKAKLGVIATGGSHSKGDTIILGDFTGEGRADYMYVGDQGKVDGQINRLRELGPYKPKWSSPVRVASGPGGVAQNQVRMVDMTGDGKVDYLQVESDGQVTLWENVGTGGMYQPGEGVFLCDLDGDGAMDYFWVDHTGKGSMYLNTGKGSNNWEELGQTAKGTGNKRSKVRMGVITKSGRADYIVVDDKTGKAWWWENTGKSGNWGWKSQGELAVGPKDTVKGKWGWDFNGKNVRFADLDGDGLDDYLYIGPRGAVIMWRNLGTPGKWGVATKVAAGVGTMPHEVQFADTNGDGRVDYITISTRTGYGRVWLNYGFRDDGAIKWSNEKYLAGGTGSAGHSIRIAEMTGDKRADYISINPDNGQMRMFSNGCKPSTDSDVGEGERPPETTTTSKAPQPTKDPNKPICQKPLEARDRPSCYGGDFHFCYAVMGGLCQSECRGQQPGECITGCLTRANTECAGYCMPLKSCDNCIKSFYFIFQGEIDDDDARELCSQEGDSLYCNCNPYEE